MKNKKYWLRGGIAGSIIGIVILFTFFILMPPHPSGYAIEFSFKYMWLPLLVTYGGPIIVGFLVGSITGCLYGKIKNKS